jgi:hypothetical protein
MVLTCSYENSPTCRRPHHISTHVTKRDLTHFIVGGYSSPSDLISLAEKDSRIWGWLNICPEQGDTAHIYAVHAK